MRLRFRYDTRPYVLVLAIFVPRNDFLPIVKIIARSCAHPPWLPPSNYIFTFKEIYAITENLSVAAANVKQESGNYSQYQGPVSHSHSQSDTFLDLDPGNRNSCFG